MRRESLPCARRVERRAGVAFSQVINTGNEASVELADYLDHLADDPATSAALCYIEELRDGPKFLAAAARFRAAGKLLAVYKVGASEKGAEATRYAAKPDPARAGLLLFGADAMRSIEKQLLLQTIDAKWREHLLRLDHMRSVVGFRGYAQRDPLNEYKTEAFQLFENMLDSLRQDVTQKLSQIRPISEEEQKALMEQYQAQLAAFQAQQAEAKANAELAAAGGAVAAGAALAGFDEADPSTWGSPSRNDPCPCGSGEKFKHCHGKLE